MFNKPILLTQKHNIMQKFLRTLMLAALMLVPFASRAQVTTFPYSCDFEDATEAAAWTFVNGTLTNQWVLGTAVNNTPSGSYGIYISNDAGTTAAYTISSAAVAYAYREFYLTPGEYTVTFDWQCFGESNWDYLLAALVDNSVTLTAGTSLPTGVSYSAMTASGWTNLGPTSPNFQMSVSSTWSTQTATFTVTTAGTYRIVFVWRNDTSGGTAPGACVDNIVVTQNSCPTPSGLLANNITSSSMDLTWTEIGAATSWLVYVNGEYDGTANSTSYSLTGLNGNTVYTIAVRSFCGAGDTSNAVTGTFRTACPESVVLPYVEEFNGYSGFQSNAYTGPSIPPACWGYFSNGTNTAATTSNAYYGGVYQATSTSYGSHEANNPYLCMPIYVVGSSASSTYTGYRNARGNVKYAIMPALATPINGLQIGFDYKMSTANSSTGANTTLEFGYTTGDDTSTFVSMWSAASANTTIQHVVDLNLSTLAAAAPAGARLAFKFHGTHNGTGTSSGTAVYCGIDNIVVENLPSCARVTNLTVSGITNNSVTLNWVDTINTGATYTVSDANGVIATGINAMTYTVTGLTANSDYTFSVVTNCSATDNSTATTVSAHTDCDAMTTLPYLQTFEAEATGSGTSAAFAGCWNRLNNGTQYFGHPYISSSSSYNHTDGGTKGLYWTNSTTTGTYGDYQCIVLPELGGTYSVSDCRLKFWAKASSTSYHPVFIVGVLTDAHDINTFVAVDTVNVEGTTWTEYTVNLNGYTGAGTFVAIRANRPTSAWYAYVDDILLEELPSCVEISDLTASNITSSSITLTWSDAANTSATYSVIGSDGSVITSGLTATTYTVTGLTANTPYTFAVVANCSATDASPAVTVSARTACEANTVFPWSDDFESYTASSSGVTLDAPCWVNEHISGGGTYFFEVYQSTSAMGGNATKMLRLHDMTSGTMTKLVLPAMEFPTGSTYQFIIDVYRNTTSYASEGVRVYASTDGEITGATELGFLYRNYTQTDNGVVTAETTSGWYTYEFTIPFTGTCYIILRGESSYGSATYMDNFIIREAPSCLAVTGLTASNITDNSITLTWTDGVNTSATYSVYDMSDTTLVESYITGTTYTVTNLTANTEYTFGVVANCSATDNSLFTTVSGRTACNAVALPYEETFATTSTTRDCWTLVSNNTANVGGQNMGFVTYNAHEVMCFSSWSSASDYNQYGYSPVLNATSLTGADSLHVRVVYGTHGADDPLYFGYTTTASTTPTDYTWVGPFYTSSYAWTTFEANLPLDAVQLAVHYASTGCNYRAYVDSIEVTGYTIPSCPAVTGLAAINIATDSARLTWVGNATSYTILDMSDSSFVASTADTTYLLENLTAMTQYTYGVVANCGFDNSDTMVVSFATACSAVTLPYTEGFEATSATSGCWQLVSNNTANEASMGFTTVDGRSVLQFSSYSSATDYNQYGFSPIMNVSTDAINLGVKVTYATRSSDYLYFGYVTANDTVWDPTAYNTNSSYSSYNWQTLEFVIPATATQLAVRYYGDYQYYAWVDSVSVVEMSASFCYPVTAVTVDSVTATSVSISWTDTTATGNYSVYNGTTYMGTTANTNYTFTGLTATTDYTFGVVALCSATDSSTMVTVGARTDCLGGSCNITINGVDAYGDGWNGASITISQNAETVGTFTLSSGSSFSQTFQVCSGAPVTFTWNSGNFDDEASFQILDGGNNVAYTCTDGSALTDGAVFTTVANACPSCIAPVLTVDAATTTSVTISWTGNAASYSVYLDSVFVANVTTNTYTFTGLTAATIYNFGVASICSATDSSSIATIAANTACNTFAIPFVENFEPEGNEVCWTIHATSTGTTFTTGSGNYVVNGTGLFAFFYSENPPQYLISPELTGTGNGVEMSFSYRVYSATYPESFMVGYSTTTNDTSAFVWSTEQTNLANTTYDRYVENLTAAGIKYVAIKYTANDMYALLIDSLVVRDIPTCDPVTALTASNVTNNSVTLNWTGTAASYDVYNGTTFVANVTTNTYTFTGLTAATAYTFGVQALCSATDSADMVTVAVSTACDDITTLPYNEGFEDGLGCWTSVNGSADGVDWNAQPAFSSGSITPHTGNYMAASWSWNGSEIDANAWLISPKFVLPTVNAGDSLTFSWWARTNHSYPDSYSVVLSNTTSDTAAFTNVIRPYAMADTSDTWVLHTVDLSAYAGQSIYIAFHHVDYDNNYLLIDDIALSQGGYVPPAPDTLTVTFAVDDATMGTTIPAPGTYQYFSGDSVFFGSQANAGYRFLMWEITFGTGANAEIDTFDAQYANGYYILADRLMSYGAVAFKAFFEAGRPDSTTITYAVNDPSLGSITPAAGTHTIYVGDTISASATAYTGAVLTAWVYDIIRNGSVLSSDTITSDDPDFTNPISFGVLSQLYITYEVSLSITAIFEDQNPGTTYYTVTGVANDPTMGYVLGSNRYEAGAEATLTAVANNGYRFVRWSNGETTATISFTVTENVELTAYFEVSTEGIEDVAAEATVFSTDNKIVVRGAEGQSIYVFDVNGRVMAREANAAESVEFRMETTGVYLVKVGTAAAKRVVVMR